MNKKCNYQLNKGLKKLLSLTWLGKKEESGMSHNLKQQNKLVKRHIVIKSGL